MDKFDASAINPDHYRQEKVQCIDAMRFFFGDNTVAHGCLFNIFKYLWRYADKNGIEDIEKAKWYMQELKRIINANAKNILDQIPENMNIVLGDSDDNSSGAQSTKTEQTWERNGILRKLEMYNLRMRKASLETAVERANSNTKLGARHKKEKMRWVVITKKRMIKALKLAWIYIIHTIQAIWSPCS